MAAAEAQNSVYVCNKTTSFLLSTVPGTEWQPIYAVMWYFESTGYQKVNIDKAAIIQMPPPQRDMPRCPSKSY